MSTRPVDRSELGVTQCKALFCTTLIITTVAIYQATQAKKESFERDLKSWDEKAIKEGRICASCGGKSAHVKATNLFLDQNFVEESHKKSCALHLNKTNSCKTSYMAQAKLQKRLQALREQEKRSKMACNFYNFIQQKRQKLLAQKPF